MPYLLLSRVPESEGVGNIAEATNSEPKISRSGVRVGGYSVATRFQTEPDRTPVREDICQHTRSSVSNEKRLATR